MEGSSQFIAAERSRAPVLAAPYDVTVLLPAFNEERAIEHVLREVAAALADEPIRYEILVVDDASTDRTADLAERFALEHATPEVRVVRMPENRGAGAAR